jgi:cytochrome c
MTRIVRPVLVTTVLLALSCPANGMSLGEKLFRGTCIGCHSIACNRSGPRLKDLFGRKAGAVEDFKGYSDALKKSGIIWSEQSLDEFLSDPGKMVPGTAMSIVSVKNQKERREIIAFIKKQDTSIDFCF